MNSSIRFLKEKDKIILKDELVSLFDSLLLDLVSRALVVKKEGLKEVREKRSLYNGKGVSKTPARAKESLHLVSNGKSLIITFTSHCLHSHLLLSKYL